jgi:hypothetical protein
MIIRKYKLYYIANMDSQNFLDKIFSFKNFLFKIVKKTHAA